MRKQKEEYDTVYVNLNIPYNLITKKNRPI